MRARVCSAASSEERWGLGARWRPTDHTSIPLRLVLAPTLASPTSSRSGSNWNEAVLW